MDPLTTNPLGIFPFPIHMGLHRLFAVYSMGLLVIAVFIAGYFIATILAETAQSGTPFGRRFNKMWAPMARSQGRLLLRDQETMKCLDLKNP